MEFDQNVLVQIATSLEYEDLLKLCSSSHRMYRLICQHSGIWIHRLNKDFPNWNVLNAKENPRGIYRLLIGLTKLKEKIKYEGTIYRLFKKTELDLSHKQITILPPEIGTLINLKVLELATNQITFLPPEIEKLINLEVLDLEHNQITTLPPEIGTLTNLNVLYLRDNQITTLPLEMRNLTNLENLYIDENVIIPPELKNLPIRY